MAPLVRVSVEVNGRSYEREVEPRLLLSDFLRHELGLTGTHVGCEHGACGACTVLLDGEAVRSCLLFAAQVDGGSLRTVEGLAPHGGALDPLQAAFHQAHGLQCGFCTPGILMSLVPFLEENPAPSRAEIRHALTGNLCRCTGYQKIVDAVELWARRAGAGGAGAAPRSAGEPAAAKSHPDSVSTER
ncbi:MAG TPA: (2Fe-2S)-binding protein [Thermoanaerobaculia bacterium]|nr:(2Fe-2S)-binding protein [Thermoanaerobaculia bacterium]